MFLRKSGLEVRCQPTGEPHQLDISLGFPLQSTRRLHPIQVAVNVQLQHCLGVVGGTAGSARLNTKSDLGKIQLVDEHVNRADFVVFGDVLIKCFWQERDLGPALTFDESAHPKPPLWDG